MSDTQSGCCGSSTAASSVEATKTSTCCGTTAAAEAEGSCCSATAKAEAVQAGAGCCG